MKQQQQSQLPKGNAEKTAKETEKEAVEAPIEEVKAEEPKAETVEAKPKAPKKSKLNKGFHHCTRVKLVKGQDNNIESFGEDVNRIKNMHESNIDEYNTQQLNTLLFIKKDGVKYKLESVYAKGRINSKGEPHPYKVFMEIKK